MSVSFLKKNIIEVIGTLYMLLSVAIYFIMIDLEPSQKASIDQIIEQLFWGEIGIYSAREEIYSKVIVNILITTTPILAVIFSPLRKQRKHYRNITHWSHYIINPLLLAIGFIFLYTGYWKLISMPEFSLFREILTFIICTCGSYAIFISECWYMVDTLERLFRSNKKNEVQWVCVMLQTDHVSYILKQAVKNREFFAKNRPKPTACFSALPALILKTVL